jgi:hypothetical protein
MDFHNWNNFNKLVPQRNRCQSFPAAQMSLNLEVCAADGILGSRAHWHDMQMG